MKFRAHLCACAGEISSNFTQKWWRKDAFGEESMVTSSACKEVVSVRMVLLKVFLGSAKASSLMIGNVDHNFVRIVTSFHCI